MRKLLVPTLLVASLLSACARDAVGPTPLKPVKPRLIVSTQVDGFTVDQMFDRAYEVAYGITGAGDLVGSLVHGDPNYDPEQPAFFPADGSPPIDFPCCGDAMGANEAGDFVLVNYSWQPFLRSAAGGDPQPLETDGVLSWPTAINQSRDIVGYRMISNDLTHAVLWPAAGSPIDLGSLGTHSWAYAINSAGDVVGTSQTGSNHTATVWMHGSPPAALKSPWKDANCDATGINDNGDVVGWCSTSDGSNHAVIWPYNGSATELAPLGGTYSQARAINNAGTVVGISTRPDGTLTATLWPNAGDPHALPQSDGAPAVAINRAGQIVSSSGIRWTPLPSDVTPPVIQSNIPQSLFWLTAPYTLQWDVTDAESAITSKSGCDQQPFAADGIYTVTCTATNAAGLTNALTVQFGIDQTPPTLLLPGNLAINATSPSGATVSYNASATDAMSGIRSFACDHPNGSNFPIGTTVVTCLATDNAGLGSAGSFTVTVLSAAQQVDNLIQSLTNANVPAGYQQQLSQVVRLVLANPTAACPRLTALLTSTRAQAGHTMPTDQATQLITSISQIKAAEGCP